MAAKLQVRLNQADGSIGPHSLAYATLNRTEPMLSIDQAPRFGLTNPDGSPSGTSASFVPVPDLEIAVRSLDMIIERLVGHEQVPIDQIAVLTCVETTLGDLRGRWVGGHRLDAKRGGTSDSASATLTTVALAKGLRWDVVVLVIEGSEAHPTAGPVGEAIALANQCAFVVGSIELRDELRWDEV